MSWYFEDYTVGDSVETPARTITEADIVNFAGLSGDYNPLHTDAVFAANGPYGKRIAHGMLIQAIATGLATRTGVIEGTALAFRELSCKLSLPVHIGDTIRVTITVAEAVHNRRLNAGNIVLRFAVVNQDGKKVQRGTWRLLVQCKPTD